MPEKTKFVRWSLLGLCATGIALTAAYRDRIDARMILLWVQDAGPPAPVVFTLIYGVSTVALLPGAMLTAVGGALFGPVSGAVRPKNLITIRQRAACIDDEDRRAMVKQ